MARERLDVLLVRKGFYPSREKARSVIMAGRVFVDGRRVDKAGTAVAPGAGIEVRGRDCPFVSRGGLKLARAIEEFDLDLRGKTVLDVGASTGGFTDCALQAGAAHVVAVDVGYGQLDWKLRNDPRVTCLERTNIRYLDPEGLPARPEVVTVDVSFISLSKILDRLDLLAGDRARFIFLVKPQFEAGREKVGKKGVVRDPAVHRQVLEKVLDLVKARGWSVRGLTHSPVRGPKGNIEYLVYAAKGDGPDPQAADKVAAVVQRAHAEV